MWLNMQIGFKHVFKNNRGAVLGVGMMVGGILLTGLFAIAALLNNTYSSELTIYYKKRLEVTRQSMMSYIRSDAAWSVVIGSPANASAGFSCLATRSCSAAPRPFSLFDSNGVRLSDPNDPSFGIDINGNPCSTFNPTNPDEACVMRYEFKWEVDCDSCIHQAPRVTGKLLLALKNTKIIVNASSYRIDFARGKELGTVGETCKSLKGKFDSATGLCLLPFVGVPCSTASSMNGTLSRGDVNCDLSPGYGLLNCPANMKPVGVNPDGSIACENR